MMILQTLHVTMDCNFAVWYHTLLFWYLLESREAKVHQRYLQMSLYCIRILLELEKSQIGEVHLLLSRVRQQHQWMLLYLSQSELIDSFMSLARDLSYFGALRKGLLTEPQSRWPTGRWRSVTWNWRAKYRHWWGLSRPLASLQIDQSRCCEINLL